MKYVPFYNYTWSLTKKYPFRAESYRIGHYREDPPGSKLKEQPEFYKDKLRN